MSQNGNPGRRAAEQRDDLNQHLDALVNAAIEAYPAAHVVTASVIVDPFDAPVVEIPEQNRYRAGGLARVRDAIRAPDGTFLSNAEIAAMVAERSEGRARGGRARAATARRASDGTFLPSV